jgi:hypothetical protein
MISDLSSRLVSREYRRWVVLACGSLAMTCAGRVGRSSEHAVEQPPVSPRVLGIAHYDDGAPAPSASIVATDLSSGEELPAAFSDGEGRFILPIKQGEFALAAAAEQGFA